MGFLDFQSHETYTYQESKEVQDKSKRLAVKQFVNLYKKFVDIEVLPTHENRYPKYGFELEVHTLNKEERNGETTYTIEKDIDYLRTNNKLGFAINHEYGAWMAEMVPRRPLDTFTYGGPMLNMLRCYMKKMYCYSKEGSEFLSLPFMPKMGTKYMLRELNVGDIEPSKL